MNKTQIEFWNRVVGLQELTEVEYRGKQVDVEWHVSEANPNKWITRSLIRSQWKGRKEEALKIMEGWSGWGYRSMRLW